MLLFVLLLLTSNVNPCSIGLVFQMPYPSHYPMIEALVSIILSPTLVSGGDDDDDVHIFDNQLRSKEGYRTRTVDDNSELNPTIQN